MFEVETKRAKKFLGRAFRLLLYFCILVLSLVTGLILSQGFLPLNATERLEETGRYLVSRSLNGTARYMLDQENKLPHVIAVGPSLTGKLESLKEVFAGSQITYEVRYGDAEYPLGGGGPGYQLYFLADGKRVLALRLAYDIFLPNLCRSRINQSARAGESAFPLTLPTTSSVQST